MRRCRPPILAALLTAAALVTGGCRSPVDPATIRDPALLRIRETFVKTVEEALADPAVDWVHGHGGNDRVAESKGQVRGYCWHWQDLVLANVRPVAETVRWRAWRININRDVFSEHHAVVVFPARIVPRQILIEVPADAFVLDPWQRGLPEIYTLREWLDIPVIVFEEASLEDDAGRDHQAGDDPEPASR